MTVGEKRKFIKDYCDRNNCACINDTCELEKKCCFGGDPWCHCRNAKTMPENELDEVIKIIGEIETDEFIAQKLDIEDDNVEHPSHYTSGGIECIDAIKASMSSEEYKGFLKSQVIKYVWRYRLKGKPTEDLKKARFYLDRLITESEASEND